MLRTIIHLAIGCLFQVMCYHDFTLQTMDAWTIAHIVLWPIFLIFWFGIYSFMIGAVLFILWLILSLAR